jgi:transcriptional regulator with XRE-family HTH domain
MPDTIGRRIFLAHLELSYRLGRKITLAEFGEMIAKRLRREQPFTGSAVSRWESGTQLPTPQIIEAIAALTHTDPGWISHGIRTAAPPPRLESRGRVAGERTIIPRVAASTRRSRPMKKRRS